MAHPDDVEYKNLSQNTGGIDADTVVRNSVSTEAGHEGAKVQHVKLDPGDGTDSEVKITDGTDTLEINADGSAKVSLEGYAAGLETAPLPAVLAGLYITKIDEASATITYIGMAAPGTATSAASWQITRIDTGTLAADILYADSNTSFDNIWDNRAALSYG